MKPLKALILGILLLVPILVFIFISVFGTHHFSLKSFYPKVDDAGGIVYDAAGDTVFQKVPYFKLKTHTGQSLSSEELSEGLYVANFFSLPCADACSRVLSQLVRVQEIFANNEQVKLVSIEAQSGLSQEQSLDGLAKEYGAREGKWYLLTGDSASVYTLASKGFHENLNREDGNSLDSPRLVLVDREKIIRGVYDGTDPEDVDRLIVEINVLLDEYSKRK